ALVIREKLVALYESEQDWSRAAQMLSGIDLDSGVRYNSEGRAPKPARSRQNRNGQELFEI
ncbi:unnamed protein product, partial [Eruca vesicaria subsp. sativa]|nr:unnamed protein product [Eruca vesicaria subsp. sativa]